MAGQNSTRAELSGSGPICSVAHVVAQKRDVEVFSLLLIERLQQELKYVYKHIYRGTTRVVKLRQTQQATALDLRMAEPQLQSSVHCLEARSEAAFFQECAMYTMCAM